MADLQVVGRTITGVQVKKYAADKGTDPRIGPQSAEASREFADLPWLKNGGYIIKKDGTTDFIPPKPTPNDCLLLTDGKDVFAASKQGMNLLGIGAGTAATLDGRKLTAVENINNPDTPQERRMIEWGDQWRYLTARVSAFFGR